MSIYNTLSNIPSTEKRLEDIRSFQKKDEVCKILVKYCFDGWPDQHQLTGIMKKYHSVAAELSVQNGLLLRRSRLVIPEALQLQVLKQLHEGHQGILKYRERARRAVWWLGLSLHELISNCAVCSQHRSQKAEPLLPTLLPGLPWERVVTDLFEWKKTTYLLVIDYYCRWIQIARLESMTAE